MDATRQAEIEAEEAARLDDEERFRREVRERLLHERGQDGFGAATRGVGYFAAVTRPVATAIASTVLLTDDVAPAQRRQIEKVRTTSIVLIAAVAGIIVAFMVAVIALWLYVASSTPGF